MGIISRLCRVLADKEPDGGFGDEFCVDGRVLSRLSLFDEWQLPAVVVCVLVCDSAGSSFRGSTLQIRK